MFIKQSLYMHYILCQEENWTNIIYSQLVNAVISQDSDCFAYGAKIVYRNFSVSSSAGGGAMQGSIDCYDAEKMFKSIGNLLIFIIFIVGIIS